MDNHNIFLKQFEKFKNREALILEDSHSVKYSELIKEIKNLSKKLIDKKKLVFLIGENNFETIIGYITFVSKGYSVLILDFKINISFLKKLTKLYKPGYIFSKT